VNGHFGLDFIRANGDEDVQEVIKELAKRNRRAKEEILKKQKMAKLKRQLSDSIGTAFGKAVERELNRRFRSLHRLRMKG